MKIKPILADMSGRLQGIVASHNRGGQYFRGRTIPDTPPSPAQTSVRVFLTNSVQRWTQDLTDAQRTAWNAFSQAHPEVDGFGTPVNIGGIGTYNKANIGRYQAGLAPVDNPPPDALATFLTPPTLTYSSTTDIDVGFDNTDPWAIIDGGALLVYASAQRSTSRYSAAGVPLRFAAAILGDTGTPPTSPVTIPLPFVFDTGMRMFFRFVAIDEAGRRSAAYRPFLDS